MTLLAMLEKSGEEMLEWYKDIMKEMTEQEARAINSLYTKSDDERFAVGYQAYTEQFKEALDIKLKLTLLKHFEEETETKDVVKIDILGKDLHLEVNQHRPSSFSTAPLATKFVLKGLPSIDTSVYYYFENYAEKDMPLDPEKEYEIIIREKKDG